MKKILSLAALALMLCVAACQKEGYKITGTIAGAQDGDTVRLVNVSGWDLEDVATTVVKDGTFTFTGRQDTAAFRYLIYETEEAQTVAQFILENGNIQVSMTPDSAVADIRGTELNERWTAFQRANYAINDRGMAFYQVTMDEQASEEEKAEAEKQLGALEEELVGLIKTFITDNVHNLAGQYLLANYAEQLDDDDFVDAQLAAITDEEATESIAHLKETRSLAAKTAVGQPLLDIKAPTPEGGELAVSEIAATAKVLMIDFWASWCGPCRAEMPNVKAAYERFHPQGFEIVGVSLDNDAEAWKKAIEDLGMTWPQISDLKGWECQGAADYGVRAIPATVLVKDGVIVARNLRGEAIAEKLEELLGSEK